jgi:hypothetical protein
LFDQVHGTFYPPISTNAISKASTPISWDYPYKNSAPKLNVHL